MGMTLENFNHPHSGYIPFCELDSTKKGDIGEGIIRSFLESKGFVCYKPVTEKAHAFDMLAIRGKREVIIAEVKAKALMTYKPATGFNMRNWQEYCEISQKHKIAVFIFFVDEHKGQIYGNWLSVLDTPAVYDGEQYPQTIKSRRGQEIRLYHYKSMRIIADIEDEKVEMLKKYTHRNYEYRQ